MYEASAVAAKRITASQVKPFSIDDTIAVGQLMSDYRNRFLSTKLRGQALKKERPEESKMLSADRSNALRLYDLINGPEREELLSLLNVSDLRDYYTAHPTVIIRDYRNALSKPV